MYEVNRILHSKVMRNGIWLTALQIFNIIAPMLTIPYITRVLGASKYGMFSIALNLILYIQVVVEYGFSMSGARKVALTSNLDEINKIYSSIFFSRLILMCGSIIILLAFVFIGGYNNTIITCIAILFSIVLGTTIQLTWFFQGMQEMKPVTIVSVFSRVVSLILIFTLVKHECDLYLYCVLYASTNIIYGVIGQFFAKKKYGIKLQKISIKIIYEEIRDGWYLFISSAMSKIFGNVGITVLGLVATDYEVGVFSAISKITSVAILLFLPVSQALFPYISQVYVSSEENAIHIVKNVAIAVIGVFTSGAGLVFIFRDAVVGIAFGVEYADYSFLLLPLLIWMIASIVNNFLGIQILVASGRQKEYSHSFMLSIIFLILYNFILINYYKIYGAAIAQAISEVTLSVFLGIYVYRLFYQRKNIK